MKMIAVTVANRAVVDGAQMANHERHGGEAEQQVHDVRRGRAERPPRMNWPPASPESRMSVEPGSGAADAPSATCSAGEATDDIVGETPTGPRGDAIGVVAAIRAGVDRCEVDRLPQMPTPASPPPQIAR